MLKADKFPMRVRHPVMVTIAIVLILIVSFAGNSADLTVLAVLFLFVGVQDKYYFERIKELDRRLEYVESKLSHSSQSSVQTTEEGAEKKVSKN